MKLVKIIFLYIKVLYEICLRNLNYKFWNIDAASCGSTQAQSEHGAEYRNIIVATLNEG